jgi:hypothetical protein
MKKQLLLLLLTLFSIPFIRAQSKLDKFVGPAEAFIALLQIQMRLP